MATPTPHTPLQLGQWVRRRFDPVDPPLVGIVEGLVFGNPDLAIVRWVGAPWTLEPEATLIAFLQRWHTDTRVEIVCSAPPKSSHRVEVLSSGLDAEGIPPKADR